MYMITLEEEGRRPVLGHLVGDAFAERGSNDEPHIKLSELGKAVLDEWLGIHDHFPQIEVMAIQMMPDHLHGILFVREKMEKPLGLALRGFKQSCNKHYRELVLGVPPVPSVALPTQQTQPAPRKDRRGEDRTHGMLFARGYNDKLLLRAGQLETWLRYLADNPRRLLMKREHPDLFRVQRNLTVVGVSFSAIGNCFLLNRPVRLFVQCSRRLTETEIQAKVQEYLAAARQGAVLVSPAISPGEKAVMRAAFNEGLPLIYLQENGLDELAKPSGTRMEACARGQLLILSPWEHHNEQITISRSQCLVLNDLARRICEND